MKKIIIYPLLFIFLVLQSCNKENKSSKVLVIINSEAEASVLTTNYLIPYLDHFGIVYELIDLRTNNFPESTNYSLLIAAHPDLFNTDPEKAQEAISYLSDLRKNGTGLLSFDHEFSLKVNEPRANVFYQKDSSRFVVFNPQEHFITELHKGADTLRMFNSFQISGSVVPPENVLIHASNIPLLTINNKNGRTVTWNSMAWMSTHVLGPLGGLDDCLWRSIVWTARKPFVMRALPPLVTMRVDDVAGEGGLWNQSPLYWVKTAAEYGFKPWLGLFIYNLSPVAVEELRGYLMDGIATASPHALGRPPRAALSKSYNQKQKNDLNQKTRFYWYPQAIPVKQETYDEFIYFDHQHFKPYADSIAKENLLAVDQWYNAHKPLPMSKYLVAHWYELSNNVIDHISDNWGMEFVAQIKTADSPWADSVPWIKGGPFRLHEEPGTSTNNGNYRGKNPVYYADFTSINGKTFFNCYTEIRDDAGYEWAPDNDVQASSGRGIRQINRALSSFALGVLFTHETDYIYRVSPENWKSQLEIIRKGIELFNPIFLTTDEALPIVRSFKASKLISGTEINKKLLSLEFIGNAELPTTVYLFTEENGKIQSRLLEVPAFSRDGKFEISTSGKSEKI